MKRVALSVLGAIPAFGAVAAVSAAALAASPVLDSTHKHWKVYSLDEGGKKTCYMLTKATSQKGTYSKRDEPYVLVHHRGNGTSELNVSSGYSYKKDSEVKAKVDENNYKLFTQGELAWAYDAKQDAEMVAAMKKGSTLKVHAVSTKDTTSTDTYSLSGFTAALNRMQKLCK